MHGQEKTLKRINRGYPMKEINEDSTKEEKEASKVGLRFNKGKLPLDQVPPSMVKAFAEIAAYGEKKYSKHNWRKGMDWSSVYACAQRHLNEWFGGQELDNGDPNNPDDKGSGLPVLYHALWNIAALIEYQEKGVGKDDRWHQSDPSKPQMTVSIEKIAIELKSE